jgi:hypothetical protein
MSGIKNNITDKLEQLDKLIQDTDSESLLQTIKCPKNMRLITDRLPEPKYSPQKVKKRSNSQSAENNDSPQVHSRSQFNSARNLSQNQSVQVIPKLPAGARELGTLPMISEEDPMIGDRRNIGS